MASYAHRPDPSGLHAKLRRELSDASMYIIGARNIGRPNHIVVRVDRRRVLTSAAALRVLWAGHRDAMPSHYRGAQDPDNLMTRPASD